MENLEMLKNIIDSIAEIFIVVLFFSAIFLCRRYKEIALCLHAKKIYKKSKSNEASKEVSFSKNLFPRYKYRGNYLYISDEKGVANFLEPLDNSSILVLRGDRGSGKTTLLKYIYKECYLAYKKRYKAFSLKSKKVVYLPIYIDKQNLQATQRPIGSYLTEICDTTMKIAEGMHKVATAFRKEEKNTFLDSVKLNYPSFPIKCKILLCLDGYNELPICIQEYLKDELLHIVSLDSIKVMITTRDIQPLSGMVIYTAEDLQADNIKLYLSESNLDLKSIDEKDLSFIRTPLLASKYCFWKMQEQSEPEENLTEALGFILKVNSTVDIFWNAYCSEIRRVYTETQGSELQGIYYLLLRYFLPYIANYIENSREPNKDMYLFSEQDFCGAFQDFYKKKQLYIPSNDSLYVCFKWKENYSALELKRFLAYLVDSIALIKKRGHTDGVKYYFVNELDQIFLASVHMYNKDICSLFTTTYPIDSNKTTMGKCFRIFYSQLMYNFFNKQLSSTIINDIRRNEILSDLYYYGDGFQQDRKKALELSQDAFKPQKRGDNTSLNWHKWNVLFIKFAEIQAESSNSTEVFLQLFGYLNDETWKDYYPIYDKIGYMFFNDAIYNAFKAALSDGNFKKLTCQVFAKSALKKKEAEWGAYFDKVDEYRKDIELLFLKKAAEDGHYHFAFNKLGKIYEDEGDEQNAFEQYRLSVAYEPNDYYAIGKMVQMVNKGVIKDGEKLQEILNIAKKAYTHVKTVSPLMDCKGIQGYPLLLTALGDYYYTQFITNKNTEDLNNAFDKYIQNVLLQDETGSFYNDKCRLIVSFLAKKYPENCHIDIYFPEGFTYTDYTEFQKQYNSIDSITQSILQIYKTLC